MTELSEDPVHVLTGRAVLVATGPIQYQAGSFNVVAGRFHHSYCMFCWH